MGMRDTPEWKMDYEKSLAGFTKSKFKDADDLARRVADVKASQRAEAALNQAKNPVQPAPQPQVSPTIQDFLREGPTSTPQQDVLAFQQMGVEDPRGSALNNRAQMAEAYRGVGLPNAANAMEGNRLPPINWQGGIPGIEEVTKILNDQSTPAEAKINSLQSLFSKQSENQKQQTETKLPVSPEDYRMATAMVDQYPLDAKTSTIQGLIEQQKEIERVIEQSKNPQLNIAPLLALNDSWFGTNLMKGYRQPASADDYRKMAQGLQETLDRQRWGMYGIDNQLVQKILGGGGSVRQGYETGQEGGARRESAPSINIMNQPAAQTAERKSSPKGPDEDALADRLLKSRSAKTIEGILTFNNALNEYVRLVKEKGLSPIGPDKDLLDTAYSELKTSYKEAKNLGALSGPDVGILLEGMKPATTIMGYLGEKTGIGGGAKGIEGSAALIKKNATNDFSFNYSNASKAYGGHLRTDELLRDWARRAGQVGIYGSRPSDLQSTPSVPSGLGGSAKQRLLERFKK